VRKFWANVSKRATNIIGHRAITLVRHIDDGSPHVGEPYHSGVIEPRFERFSEPHEPREYNARVAEQFSVVIGSLCKRRSYGYAIS
jgi:hypothetical protein